MIDEIIGDLNNSIGKSQEAFKRDLSKLRTGRAHAGMLDSIRVDYYGTPTPLQQLAGISVPEPAMLMIRPWDRSTLGLIERAILQSDLGL
ncbi:MAG TPA: ribosome-recycling factor, partial [Polyangiaceae bacterium]|nr:ribosome-recycling factor [Polyangiaceae bacterium]